MERVTHRWQDFWHYRGRARAVVSPEVVEIHAELPSSNPRRLDAPRLLARYASGARVGARLRSPAHRRQNRRDRPPPAHDLAYRINRQPPSPGRRLGGADRGGAAAADPVGPARGDLGAWCIPRAFLRRILPDCEWRLPRSRLVFRHWGLRRDASAGVVSLESEGVRRRRRTDGPLVVERPGPEIRDWGPPRGR